MKNISIFNYDIATDKWVGGEPKQSLTTDDFIELQSQMAYCKIIKLDNFRYHAILMNDFNDVVGSLSDEALTTELEKRIQKFNADRYQNPGDDESYFI